MKRTWLAPLTSVHHPLIYPTRLAASTLWFQVSSGALFSLLQPSTLESFLPYCIFHLNQGFKSANTNIPQIIIDNMKICSGVSANPFKKGRGCFLTPFILVAAQTQELKQFMKLFIKTCVFENCVPTLRTVYLLKSRSYICSQRTLLNVRPYRLVCQRQMKKLLVFKINRHLFVFTPTDNT